MTAKVVTQAQGPEDPHRQVQEAHRLQAPHGLPRLADADRDRVDRRAGKSTAKQAAKPKAAAPAKDETPAEPTAAQVPAGLPEGYADLTVAQVKEAAAGWDAAGLRAALEYEQAHGKRKGAIAALEAAISEAES